MMSSFANQLRVSRREISHDPPASTHDRGSPPPRQKRTDASILCPRSPPAGPVLPHIPRPHLRTGAAARLPAPETRRRPPPRPECGGGQATPSGGHPLPQSSLLHHRL